MSDDSTGIEVCPSCKSADHRRVQLGVYAVHPGFGPNAIVMVNFLVCEKDGTMWMPKAARDMLVRRDDP